MSPSMMPTRLPELGERDGDVHRDGRLPDAALARADGNHVLHARHRQASAFGHRGRSHRGRHLDVDRRHAGHRGDQRLRLRVQSILHGTRRRRQLDRERYRARVRDLEALHEPEADDVLSEVRIDDAAQRIEHGGLTDEGRHQSSLPASPGKHERSVLSEISGQIAGNHRELPVDSARPLPVPPF